MSELDRLHHLYGGGSNLGASHPADHGILGVSTFHQEGKYASRQPVLGSLLKKLGESPGAVGVLKIIEVGQAFHQSLTPPPLINMSSKLPNTFKETGQGR